MNSVRLSLLSIVVVFAIAAVGTTAVASPQAAATVGCKAPAKYRGDHARNYTADCQVCRIFGPKAVAKEYGIRSTNPLIVATEYARKSYRPAYRAAGAAGCLRGFQLRGRP